MSSSPSPQAVDLATLLYMNPELVAYSNLTSLPLAAAAWAADQVPGGAGTLSSLACTMPMTPAGFSPRVYAAAQPDVSGANETIRLAMAGIGLTATAIERRGTFVSTLSQDVTLVPSASTPTTISFMVQGDGSFGPSNMSVGDRVRIQRSGRGDTYDCRVSTVDAPAGFTIFRNRVPAWLDRAASGANQAIDGGTQGDAEPFVFTALGIKLWDAERQALVAYARNQAAEIVGAAGTVYVDQKDVVPDPGFSVGMYRAVYPDTRALSQPDAYIDYRTRWKRNSEYRLIKGTDVFNLSAPYASNLLSSGGNGCNNNNNNSSNSSGGIGANVTTDLIVAGDVICSGGGVQLSRSNAYFSSNLTAGAGFLSVTGRSLTAGVPGWMTGSWQAPLRVAHTSPTVSAVSICACNVVITPAIPLSVKNGSVVVTGAGDLVVGGAASNLSVSQATGGPASLGNGALVVRPGSVTVTTSVLSIYAPVATFSGSTVSASLYAGGSGGLVATSNYGVTAGALAATPSGDVVMLGAGGGSNLASFGASSALLIGAGQMLVSQSNVSVRSNLGVDGRVGVAMPCLGSETSASNGQTRLAVLGEGFFSSAVEAPTVRATGLATLATLNAGSSNLNVSSASVTIGGNAATSVSVTASAFAVGSSLCILSNGDVVLGGSSSNVAILKGSSQTSTALLGAGQMLVSQSNVSVRSNLGVAGRVGVAMPCLGSETSASNGQTRLAVLGEGFFSSAVEAPTVRATGLATLSTLIAGACNAVPLTVSSNAVTMGVGAFTTTLSASSFAVGSSLSVASSGDVVLGGVASNVVAVNASSALLLGAGQLLVSQSNVSVRSNLGVSGRVGVAMPCLGSETSASNGQTRLAVLGEGFFSSAVEAPTLRATGLATLATLNAGSSNLTVSSASVTIGVNAATSVSVTASAFAVGSSLYILPNGDVGLGGSTSNVAILKGTSTALLGAGQLIVSQSNVSVRSNLGVSGRVGVAMPCLGSETSASNGQTRLAVLGEGFFSSAVEAPTVRATGLATLSTLIAGACNAVPLTVSSNAVTVGPGGGTLSVGANGDVVLGGALSNLASISASQTLLACAGQLVVSTSNVSVQTNLGVAGRVGIGMACLGYEGPTSNGQTRLAIAGDVYCTGVLSAGTLSMTAVAFPTISVGSCNLIVTTDTVTMGTKRVFSVTPSGDVVLGGAASNLVALAGSASTLTAGAGQLLVSLSNVSIRSNLGVDGRIGVSMPCLGSETSASNGQTRLAVLGEGYFSHAVEAPTVRATGLATLSTLVAGACNAVPLRVSSNAVTIGSGSLSVCANGDVVLGGSDSNVASLASASAASLGAGQLIVSKSNVSVRSNLGVDGRIGVSMHCLGSETSASNGLTRLAVLGEGFFSHAVEAPTVRATGLAALSTLNAGAWVPLIVSSDAVTIGGASTLAVTDSGDVVHGGAASNMVCSSVGSTLTAGAGQMTVSSSNVSVASVLGVGGRVGIGMACTGGEGDVPVGWYEDPLDRAQNAGTTRLAVAGDIFATGTIVTLSDARAKSSIRRIGGALSRLRRLHGYTFASSAPGASSGRRHTGLLAQDVSAVLPEAVYGVPRASPDDPRLSSIAYGNLAGLFVEAIKELDRSVKRADSRRTHRIRCRTRRHEA